MTVAVLDSGGVTNSAIGYTSVAIGGVTPPAGGLVLVTASAVRQAWGGVPSIISSDGGSWTSLGSLNNGGCAVNVFVRYYAAAPGSITITMTTPGSNQSDSYMHLGYSILLGAKSTQTGTVQISGKTNTNNYSQTITALAGSQVYGTVLTADTSSISTPNITMDGAYTTYSSRRDLNDGASNMHLRTALVQSAGSVSRTATLDQSASGIAVLLEIIASDSTPPPGTSSTITQDPSTPTIKSTTTFSATSNALVSNSFTPPAKSLVIVHAGLARNGASAAPTMAISSSPAATWNLKEAAFQDNTTDGKSFFYWAYFDSSPGPMTVTTTVTTGTATASYGHVQDIRVLMGAAANQAAGASVAIEKNALTTDYVDNITSTTVDSQVFAFMCGTRVASGTTVTASGVTEDAASTITVTSGSIFIVNRVGKPAPTVTPGLLNIGWNFSAASAAQMILVEILPYVVVEPPIPPDVPTYAGSGPMVVAPSKTVIDAFVAPTSFLKQRMEVYESDGNTPWKPEIWNSLVDGTVNVTYESDERRNVDMTIDNFDGAYNHNPGNFWYNKVVKLYYGIQVNERSKQPSIVIIEEYNALGQALALKNTLNAAGFTKVRVNVAASTFAHTADYDIVISLASDYTKKLGLLQQAFDSGKSVLTLSLDTTAAQLPYVIGTASGSTSTALSTHQIRKTTSVAHPVQTGWTNFTAGAMTYRKITAPAAGAVQAADFFDSTAGTSAGLIVREAAAGNRWAHLQHIDYVMSGATDDDKASLRGLIGSVAGWLDTFEPVAYWEVQIGEFVPIDIGVEPENDEVLRVTGKDYTDRCMQSKLSTATTFSKGTSIDGIIRAQASNSKCFKTSLAPSGRTLPVDVTYEADTERWKIMKEMATSINYELYFNAKGFLVWRPFQDPLLTPPSLVLSSGEHGNIVSKASKTSSARLRNRIVVRGESSDVNKLPVWAEARNTEPTSPSNIESIGDRSDSFTSSLYTTTAQCQEAANMLLRVAALEEYSMDFSAILFPWLEAGSIVELSAADVEDAINEPQRFLLSTISLPLSGDPMSGTGRRVTVIV